jgi:hypothetical protein
MLGTSFIQVQNNIFNATHKYHPNSNILCLSWKEQMKLFHLCKDSVKFGSAWNVGMATDIAVRVNRLVGCK